MKKLLLFIILSGAFLGLFLGVRTSVLNREKLDEPEIKVDTTYKDEIILPLIEIDNLNPILTNNRQIADTLKLVYEPLFDFDNQNRLTSVLGMDYMEKDDLTWIITLRENVLWHSGKPFLPEDVLYTIDSIKSNPQSSFYNSLKNVYYAEKLSDNSIAIYLFEKDVFFPYRLTFPIFPQYYLQDSLLNVEKLNRPIGTGPYKYVSSDEDTMTLHFNSNWWRKIQPKLNTIFLKKYQTYGEAIKAFKSSEIDVIITSMESWEKKFGVIGINSYRYENEKFDLLIPNCNKAILKENSVRRAILYAINRENIIDKIYENNAIKQDLMLHTYSWLNDKSLEIEYSQDKAKQLLTNSMWHFSNNSWSKNIDGKYYTLRLNLMVIKDNDNKKEVAKVIKENLESIGIKITISEVDTNTYQKNIDSGNFDLALGTLETRNELDLLELMKNKNYANYDMSTFNEDYAQLYASNIYLNDAFKKLQMDYKNELPYIGLYYKTSTLLTNKAVKGNIMPAVQNPYMNIWTWSK